jgi:hypothetical protein
MERRPPRVTLVLSICAALGATGLSLGLAGVLAWNEPLAETAMPALPEPPPGDEAAWAQVEEAYRILPGVQMEVLRERRPALHALSAVNFVASAALLFGALAARLRRRGGIAALRTGLVLSQAWAVIATVVQTWVQVAVLERLHPVLEPLLEAEGMVRNMALTALGAQGLAIALTAGVTLIQLVFFVWAHRWTRRPAVQEALAPLEGA